MNAPLVYTSAARPTGGLSRPIPKGETREVSCSQALWRGEPHVNTGMAKEWLVVRLGCVLNPRLLHMLCIYGAGSYYKAYFWQAPGLLYSRRLVFHRLTTATDAEIILGRSARMVHGT